MSKRLYKKSSEIYDKIEQALIPEARFKTNIKAASLNYLELKMYSEKIVGKRKDLKAVYNYIEKHF